MALVPATITVNFIANYAGGHRVCWRQGGTGPYDCSTTVVCVGGGSPCSATIAVSVDNETCDNVVFDGYVQAECEALDSVAGRVTWSTTFSPNPLCDAYAITCTTVGVSEIVVTNPGGGYNPASSPISLTVSGTATAQAIVGNGGLKTFTLTSPGSGYNGTADYFNVPAISGGGNPTGGTGALCDVKVVAGVVTAVTLVYPGTGYADTETFIFNDSDLGNTGLGSGVEVTITAVNTGEIQSVTVLTPGSGYSLTPSVSIVAPPAGPSAVQAVLTAVLGGCGTIADLGTDCDGNDILAFDGIGLNESFWMCSETLPTPGTGYIVDSLTRDEMCCYNCMSVTFTNNTGITQRLIYIDCSTRALISQDVLDSNSVGPICVVEGAYYFGGTISTPVACV
jgi:hypothetical protein